MITLKKIIPVSLLYTGLMLITVHSYADCNVSSSGNVSIGTIPSIMLAETGIASNQFSAGLNCSGFSLAFANMTYLKYRVDQMPVNYINSVTGERLIVNYLDTNNNPITLGQERDMSSFTIVNFFSGPNGSLPFYAKINSGHAVSPGIYRAETPFKVKWYYSVPQVAFIGFGSFFQSHNFSRGFLGLGFSWGGGSDASLNLSLTVLPDCRISTNDVNLGTAAFADAFVPVQTSMGIRCSAKTSYNVGLNNGLNPQGSLPARAMKSELGNNYLRYEIYKNSSTERWGSNGSERWSSANATTNAGNYDAITQQGYTFTTKILENNLDNLPAGKYSDTVTVQVEF
ncbi:MULTISPECIES: spore coat U domain-containing protein [Acinetobacter]|uniref:Csu type fimbrial protein n=1 Tax=Acinetobacter TaxID=469 RepID=UPI00141A9352|nr:MULTISPECIES: spore coat U domain-containing protein [Acinetobacter]MCS4299132.1 spore coat protein U-like protein [Acinetobacter guillouiae]MCW2250221.1 spore coat protein U-like protein [Acinetobacter sp. BIGb0204]NII39324.1 spore coat protein U-like protein [Acinetobacter sp. BIGb0196]